MYIKNQLEVLNTEQFSQVSGGKSEPSTELAYFDIKLEDVVVTSKTASLKKNEIQIQSWS